MNKAKIVALGAFMALLGASSAEAQPVVPKLGGTGCPNTVTVSQLGTYARAGALCMVSDGTDASDCTTGGGSAVALCCYMAGAWGACGGGGAGGSGDVTKVGDCATGECFTTSSGNSAIVFDGITANDGKYTILGVADPAGAYTLSLPPETGTLCSDGSVCTGYAAYTHSHPEDITAVGNCAAGECFNGTQGYALAFEGVTADDYEILLTSADPAADYTVTIPAETGTICTTASTNTDCGKVRGVTSTDKAIATWNGTTGKTLRNGQCTIVDSDGEGGGLGDKIDCPGGFVADNANGLATPRFNKFQIGGNGSITGSPTCAAEGETGYLTIIDTSESAGMDFHACSGNVDLGSVFTKREVISAAIANPTNADSGLVEVVMPMPGTVVGMNCSTDTGGVVIQWENRGITTPNTTGTDIFGATTNCDNNNANTTNVDSGAFEANDVLALRVDAKSGSPTKLRVNVTYTTP